MESWCRLSSSLQPPFLTHQCHDHRHSLGDWSQEYISCPKERDVLQEF